MERTRKLIGSVTVLIVCTLVFAGKWDKKPFTQWSQKEVLSLLRKSPWSKQQVIRETVGVSVAAPREGSGGGGGYGRASTPRMLQTYSIRFASSRPVRMALARWAMLNQGWDEAEANKVVEEDPFEGNIVVAVSIPPSQDPAELEISEDQLKEIAFLRLKKSKREIYLTRYLPPSTTGKNEAYFFFPRQRDGEDLITLDEKEVRFECRLNGESHLTKKFKLKNMVFNGKLEI